MSDPTAWEKLQDQFYRKTELYDMSWNGIDLQKQKLCGAQFGGPIAVTRDPKKIVLIEGEMAPTIQIFSSSGWNSGKIITMGWTDQERLILITEDGIVHIYSVTGNFVKKIELSPDSPTRILDGRVWGNGVVCFNNNLQLIGCVNFDEERLFNLPDPGLTEAPTSWTVIPPQQTLSGSLEVFIGTVYNTILIVDAKKVEDQLLSNGPFTSLSVSPSGKILACFTKGGDLWVVSTDFTKNYCELSLSAKEPPIQMVWCGTDSVILYWPEMVFMVGPLGDWIKYSYESDVYLVPEVDGVRIITNDKCEFIQKVPPIIKNIFQIGATNPPSILYDAWENFQDKNPSADENIRSIKQDLKLAIDGCIDAAAHEFDIKTQKNLLEAASFGKCFVDLHNPSKFVAMAKTLRVLNAVRNFEVGIPLTFRQFSVLTAEVVIDRLINRNLHLLAWRLCDYLSINSDRVLVHWASQKVKTNLPDDQISDIIIAKLSQVSGVSYAGIASEAWQANKPNLATRLLDYEPKAAEQVPLLLSMGQDEHALTKAIESGDTDLVYLVLLHLLENKPNKEDFFRIISGKPVARDLLIAYCKEKDLPLLKEIYKSSHQPQNYADTEVIETYKNAQDIDSRISGLNNSLILYNQSKESLFQAKMTEEQIKLLLLQKSLESTIPNQNFIDLSLTETISKLILLGELKRTTKVKSEFKIPDKRYWWIRIKAVAEKEDWAQLEKISKEKKSPIGYEPFAQVCLEKNNPQEAVKYIHKITDPYAKVESFCTVGYWREAGDTAVKEKDPELLLSIRNRCNVQDSISYLDQLLSQF